MYVTMSGFYGSRIGSPKGLWDLLKEAQAAAPVVGNVHGSYTTFRCVTSLTFGRYSPDEMSVLAQQMESFSSLLLRRRAGEESFATKGTGREQSPASRALQPKPTFLAALPGSPSPWRYVPLYFLARAVLSLQHSTEHHWVS